MNLKAEYKKTCNAKARHFKSIDNSVSRDMRPKLMIPLQQGGMGKTD